MLSRTGRSRAKGAGRIAKRTASKPKALKVYRTAIGFHDAYVAAPSKKAALEAWGSRKDLFARGAAEVVEDPALMRAALESPGTVIKVSRGSVAEQLAALPKSEVGKGGAERGRSKPESGPRPDRAVLDSVEREIDTALKSQAKDLNDIARREKELAAEKRDLLDRQQKDMAALEQRRDETRRVYDAAMKKWRG